MDPPGEDGRGRGGDGSDDEGGGARRRQRGEGGEQFANLLRLLAGQRAVLERRAAAGSNEELVGGLRRGGMLSSEAVARTMLLVPRGEFVPPEHAAEAYVDSPIRVEEHDFNISAPHMHAQMLESLSISPGDRVLDVGCGCGFLAACAAVLAGKSGSVVGCDIKPAAISLSRNNIARLTTTSSEFASSACEVVLMQHNVFMPSPSLKGRFNKVCVGATVPEDRLHLLLPLLEPAGGQLLAPVDNDLRLYTRGADGKLRQRLVSSVRFSDLEVPSDASIALCVLREEQAALMRIDVSPSTLADDLAHDDPKGGCSSGFMHMWSSCFTPHSSDEAPTSMAGSLDSTAAPDTPVIWQRHGGGNGSSGKPAPRRSPSSGADAPAGPEDDQEPGCASAGASASGDEDTAMADSHPLAAASCGSGKLAALGPPDCELLGHGWKLHAHKSVLKSRAAHFRARGSSGMRDAHDCEHKVPEGFSLPCMEALLSFMYTDELADGLEPSGVVELLHAGSYYGTPRLIELCEARLVEELLQLAPAAAAAEAPHLLSLADELGLIQLRRAAVAFIAQHYDAVQASDAWHTLDRCQVELVTAQLAGEMGRLKQLLSELEPPAASTPRRRGWW